MPNLRPSLRPIVTVASLVLLAAGPVFAQSPTPPEPRTAQMGHRPAPHHAARLSVSGEGRATAQPDLAHITLGVTTEAETAQEAMAKNATRQQAVIDALKAEGVEPRDIQTSGLNLSPKMQYTDNQPPKLVGYTAQNTVNVRVRDIAGLGGVLDKLVATGANEISGISFSREDMTEAQDKARSDAVTDARRRAEIMAQAAGMRLGELRALSDSAVTDAPRPMMAMRAELKDAAVPIEAGELGITAQVTAIFDLLPAEGEAPAN